LPEIKNDIFNGNPLENAFQINEDLVVTGTLTQLKELEKKLR